MKPVIYLLWGALGIFSGILITRTNTTLLAKIALFFLAFFVLMISLRIIERFKCMKKKNTEKHFPNEPGPPKTSLGASASLAKEVLQGTHKN